MTIVLDGQPSKIAVTTFQPIPSNSPNGNFVSTLTLVSTLRLVAEQYLSIFIEVQCQSVAPWKVLANSSFSVVLVSRWESDYNAGFLASNVALELNRPGFNIINYWKVALFSKNLKVTSFHGINIKSSGLYFLQSVVTLYDVTGNKTFDSGVCTADKIALSGITASKVSEGLTGKFAISAFGVLYLRKGQNVNLCVRSKTNTQYQRREGSWFSMVRFLPLGQPPGFHQILQDTRNISVYCEWSVIRSMSTGGGQLAYIKNNIFNPNPTLPCDKGDFTAPLSGTYLISVMFTLKGNASDNVTACVGIRKCGECYIEVSNTVRQHNSTSGFVGLVDLEKGELISTCLKSKDQAFSLITATRSVQFLSVVELNRTVQLKHRSIGLSTSSSGWHELVEWETRSGKSLQNVYVNENGLYILSTNVQLAVDVESLVGVKIEATGSPIRDVLSILSNSETGSTVTYSVAVAARLNASEAIAVSVYSNSQYASTINTTFFAALVTKDNRYPCLSLRSKTSRYDSGEWWKGIEHWESVDAECVSPNSDFTKGIFVADVAGVYFLAAVVVVRTSHLSHQTR